MASSWAVSIRMDVAMEGAIPPPDHADRAHPDSVTRKLCRPGARGSRERRCATVVSGYVATGHWEDPYVPATGATLSHIRESQPATQRTITPLGTFSIRGYHQNPANQASTSLRSPTCPLARSTARHTRQGNADLSLRLRMTRPSCILNRRTRRLAVRNRSRPLSGLAEH
jgi:hypothetical protein